MVFCGKNAHLGTAFLQQQQQAQRLRIGDVQIVAGQHPHAMHATRLGHGLQIGPQQTQPRGLDKGHRQIGLVGSRKSGRQVRQKMIITARHQPLVWPRCAKGQGVGPVFSSVRPLVLGLPQLDALKLGHDPQPGTHSGLVRIGEPTPIVRALTAAQLVTDVHATARFECSPQLGQDPMHVRKGYMQKTGTTPDRIVLGHLLHILKAPNIHRKTAVLTGPLGQLFRSIKCADCETQIGKCACITTRATTGVQDACAGGEPVEKPFVNRTHVHPQS